MKETGKFRNTLERLSQIIHPGRWVAVIGICIIAVSRIIGLIQIGFGDEILTWGSRWRFMAFCAIGGFFFLLAEIFYAGVFSDREEIRDYFGRVIFALWVELSLMLILLTLALFRLPMNY